MASEPAVRNSWRAGVVYNEKWQPVYHPLDVRRSRASSPRLNARRGRTTTTASIARPEGLSPYVTPTRLFFDPGFSVSDATILPAERRY